MLLILDDLHWGDRTTLQLMTYLCGLDLGRVLFVGAHRDSERPDGPLVETLGGLHRNADVTRVALHGLTPQHVVALMTAVTGREPDEMAVELAHLLHQQSAGNPFYLTEMLRHLVETDVIIGLPDGGCTASVPISSAGFPDSIREVLTVRVARLGDRAASTLSMAAVIGQEFDIDILASAAEIGEDDLLDLLEATARTALVQEADHQAGRYRFAHALVQQTLYTGLSPTRRTRAHARVAAAMETLGGREPGELAYHYLAGMTAATTARAIHHARAAGQRALAISAPNEAVRWYSAALNALPPPRDDLEHARLQLDLGIAQRHAADPNYRETLLSTARTAQHNGADDLLVEAAIAVNPGGFSSLGQVDTEKVAVLESALTVVGSTMKRARLLAALSGELTWHPDHRRRIELADEAVAVARRSGDSGALFDAIIRPAVATWVPQTSARRARLFREAVDLADRAHDPMARNQAVGLLAPTLLEQGAADRFEDALDAAAKVAMDIREPLLQWVTLLPRWCLTIVRGDLELAEAQGAELLQLVMDSADGREGHAEVLGIVRWHQGRLAEALPGLRTALARLRGVPTRWAGLAFAEAIGGDRGQAKVMLGEAATNDFDLPYGPAWLGSMCQWAAVAAELGDTGAATTLYSRLSPWKDLFGTGGPMPVHGVSHALGRLAALLGQPETADQHFTRAWRIHQRMRAPFYTAETGLYWGQMLIPSNPDRARTLLTRALELARTHGFGDVERRALQTLADA